MICLLLRMTWDSGCERWKNLGSPLSSVVGLNTSQGRTIALRKRVLVGDSVAPDVASDLTAMVLEARKGMTLLPTQHMLVIFPNHPARL